MRISKLIASMFLLGLFLSGCSAEKIANTKHLDAEALKQATSSTKTPQQVCEEASSAIVRANKEELHFFAPLHIEQASENIEEGLSLISNKDNATKGVEKCFKASRLVDDGIAVKSKVKASLNDALSELDMLKKVDEEKKFTGDIQEYSEEIVGLIKKIEAGKMNEAMQGQAELLKEMLELEVEIVTDKHLTPVAAMLEKAEDADADDLAEKTFEKAEKELESARKFIQANYRNDEQVEMTSALAMRSAKHAFYVAKEVEGLKELKRGAAEEKVLYIESLLERINKKFNKEVIVGNSLYEQSTIIGQRLDVLIDDKTMLAKEVSRLKEKNSVVVTKVKVTPTNVAAPVALEVKSAAQTENKKPNIDEKNIEDTVLKPEGEESVKAATNEGFVTEPLSPKVKPEELDAEKANAGEENLTENVPSDSVIKTKPGVVESEEVIAEPNVSEVMQNESEQEVQSTETTDDKKTATEAGNTEPANALVETTDSVDGGLKPEPEVQ